MVTFPSVHPPNVSTVVFALKHAVLMPSRKLLFGPRAHTLSRSNTRIITNPRDEAYSAELNDGVQAATSCDVRAPMFWRRLQGGCKFSTCVLHTKRHPNTHTKVPHRLQHCTTPSGGYFLQLRIQMNSGHSKACECYFALIPRSTPQEKPQSFKCLLECACQFSTCGNINRPTRC